MFWVVSSYAILSNGCNFRTLVVFPVCMFAVIFTNLTCLLFIYLLSLPTYSQASGDQFQGGLGAAVNAKNTGAPTFQQPVSTHHGHVGKS